MDSVLLDRLDAVVDALFDVDLDACCDDDVLAVWRRLETVSRRLSAVDHRVVAQVRDRHLDFTHGASSVAALARQVLRIPAREAKARLSGADAAGPRVAVSGEVLEPVYGDVAAAQAEGQISAVHARMIVRTIEQLPHAVQDTDAAAAEVLLVEQARVFDPDSFAKITQRLTDTLDPDGRFSDAEDQQRRRDLRLTTRPNGTGHLDGELTAELTEHLRTAFDALAAPVPAEGGIKDARTPGQRTHDALLDLVKMSEQAQLLPHTGGFTATLILTADATDWAHRSGLTRTGHGVVLPTDEAQRWVSGDTKVIAVALDRMRRVVAYSDSRRLFTPNQRLAMLARDHGCAFPGCDAPPQRCEAHHVTEYADGGTTSTDNGALMCSFHHREHQRMGWQSTMINGIPHFIPPRWLDPARQPRRNVTHDPPHCFPSEDRLRRAVPPQSSFVVNRLFP